jgi:hypothetical protein
MPDLKLADNSMVLYKLLVVLYENGYASTDLDGAVVHVLQVQGRNMFGEDA